MPQTIHMSAIESSLSSRQRLKGPGARNTGHSTVPSLHVLLSDASIGTRTVLRKSVERMQSRASIRSALHEPDLVTAEVFVGHDGIFMRREDSWQPSSACTSLNSFKWLRTSGITAGIPVAAPLHHMDERLMHPEDRGTRWRRAMQAD